MQIKIGQWQSLKVTKIVDFGVYLNGGDEEFGGWGDILLPARYAPADAEIGDSIYVFIYFDSEDRIIATNDIPKATVGQFAYLRVVDVNKAGAFLDWGLPKDLLVPYAEQANKMRTGAYYIVYIYQDEESMRVTASSRISRFISKNHPTYSKDEVIDVLVIAETDLGYKCIVNHQHWGMLYRNEVFEPLSIGQKLRALIKKIRDDGKIDLQLPQPKKYNLSELEQSIMDRLHANHGLLRVGDKTDPQVIYRLFRVSKKNFKRAVSRLYKQRLISVEAEKITIQNTP